MSIKGSFFKTGMLKAAALGGSLLFASLATITQAHPLWILPSDFNFSGDERSWVTFDVSASHRVFAYDKGVGLETVQIVSPDGDRNYLGNYFKGHRRSVFDLLLDQNGTYKVFAQRPRFYFTSYKSGKRDTPKRMMADKVAAQQKLPKNAREVNTKLIDLSSVVYITRNAPTDSAYQPTGKGLELNPITHPNDIVQGEELVIEILLNGKPAAGVNVEITPGGTRYRDERNHIQIVTDKTGRVLFTPEQAGPWLISASQSMPSESPLADTIEAIRYLTFEVIAG
ncbi:DUF4198 domain-containing protein [Motiliproteus sp. MSK22-1]|uniref:DUF4198 domain-containing protein n=1 Tax=Motiliproteus sp. MSK22-1 TaxID=1897630 RepID=UPI0009F9BD3B|nr:DUF4198 domain-containing protein [Motiliproteus sp. MSK22-1]